MEQLQQPAYFSEQRGNLYKALSQAQSEFLRIPHNKKANYGEYADLDTIWDHIREPLTRHALTVTQLVCGENGKFVLYTHIGHESGQWMQSRLEFMPSANTRGSVEQALGSSISYYKRYSLVAILGLNDGGDNDGEQNVVATAIQPVRKQESEFISTDQLQQLEYELKDQTAIKARMLAAYGYDDLHELPRAKFQACLNRIREIKHDEFGV